MRVMIVDDSLAVRLLVRKTFEPDGHEVIEAPNGAVALSLLEKEPSVDVVILDWLMPVMHGLECLKRIREEKSLRNVKIVMCTSRTDKKSIVDSLQAGADAYVLKPVQTAQLKSQVLTLPDLQSSRP